MKKHKRGYNEALRAGDKHITYGGDKTWHSGGSLDVEVNDWGEVVAVWFRCHPLPFKQADVEIDRASEMIDMYSSSDWANMPIHSIVFEEEEDGTEI